MFENVSIFDVTIISWIWGFLCTVTDDVSDCSMLVAARCAVGRKCNEIAIQQISPEVRKVI